MALALKARWPQLPLVPLTLACYGPDWVEVAMMIPRPLEGTAPYTHSIPAVLLGAALAAALFALVGRPRGAAVVALAWLLHWPADLLTGRKPVGLELAPLVGLDLYHLPLVDYTLEASVILAGAWLYRRRLASTPGARRVVELLTLSLLLLQGAFDHSLRRLDPQSWRPSLARAGWQPHLSSVWHTDG